MPDEPLTPLRFAPIFKTALWGGTRLRSMFDAPASPDPIGEAWVLSDQGNNLSVVAEGPWAGTTLRQLLERMPGRILGPASLVNGRFPILLKFLHARQPLSVQVHPTDAKARELESPSAVGKTEAWVVLEAEAHARLYSGLQPGVTPEQLRRAIETDTVEDLLYVSEPGEGDCVYLPAGAVHSIGAGLLLFEIQQTSDLTYRLYDWGRIDPKTNAKRELHIDKGLASVDYAIGPCRPAYPTEEAHGRIRPGSLVHCDYFRLSRWDTDRPFQAGAPGECRVLVGVHGRSVLSHRGVGYPIGVGDVWLLPAEVGACDVVPRSPAMILECSLPGSSDS